MSSRFCEVSGCKNEVKSTYSRLCDKHKKTKRRNGDSEQETIRKHMLEPHVKQVREIIKRDKTGKIEMGLMRIRESLLSQAQERLDRFYRNGEPMVADNVKVSTELKKVLEKTDALTCGCTIAGLYLLREQNPRLFKSDTGFFFQLARSFRALSDMNKGSYYNQKTGKTQRVYRDIPPRVMEGIADALKTVYSSFIGHIVNRIRQEAGEKEVPQNLIKEGFESIK
jgi:hypothetical protein